MLLEWQRRAGTYDLVLLSLDTDDATVESFRKEHPSVPPSLRIKDPALAEDWVVSLGLDKGATLPIHVFVDDAGGVRCARTGGVSRDHQAVVQRLLSGP